MAAALITTTGSSGKVLLRYKIGTTQHNIETDIGNIYIEDTATDITYTTLIGDATSSSTQFTIISLPFIYYNLFWKGISANNYSFVSFINNESITLIPSTVQFPKSEIKLANVINGLNIDLFKIIKYKELITVVNPNIGMAEISYSYIIKTIESPVEFKIKNADNTGFIYLKPDITTLQSLIDYTDIDTCVSESNIPLN